MTEGRAVGTRKIILHVGTPKTGTSYAQDVLFRNRVRLGLHGILYPADRFDAHFLAALDLMRLRWGGLEEEAIGQWDRLAEQVRRHPGTSIISHEILATASRSQVGRALESLGHGSGGPDEPEVHVVLSVRDLTRQIPAEWQENVKHRRSFRYSRFLELIRDPERSTRLASWFWGVQEIPSILDRWAHDLPPERVHLVTVPPSGGAPEVLWQRFAEAFDLRGLDLDLETGRSNPSLGVPEIALLRRVNRAVNKQIPPDHYRPLVRELLAHQTLSQRRTTPRLGLPPALRQWVGDLERSWVDEITTRGYHVIGDVGELVGSPQMEGTEAEKAATPWADPDRPRERAVARAAVAAIAALLVDNARMREEEARLRAELHETQLALERAYLRPTYRARAKVVRRLESEPAGRAVMKGYRRLRGRSSRSA
ncbi:hypothetical protein [Nocardioides rubriscoriae]|uniref:hypothetical protein n=1 Tax=Nocardioides rubriscoriae TaxID=642762 RepID=UPI001FE77148|nr:hypothetical protein [Nocardioides rubriscoriae]